MQGGGEGYGYGVLRKIGHILQNCIREDQKVKSIIDTHDNSMDNGNPLI